MLNQLATDRILFLDIETVPGVPDFNQMSDKMKILWEKKSRRLQAEEGELPMCFITGQEFSLNLVKSSAFHVVAFQGKNSGSNHFLVTMKKFFCRNLPTC